MEEKRRGGARPNAGRPETDRKIAVTIRISQEAFGKLNLLTNNKSQFIDNLIKRQKK